MRVEKTIELTMKSGEKLVLEMSDVLLGQIRDAFYLKSVDEIDDNHVKRYLVSAMRKSLEVNDGNVG